VLDRGKIVERRADGSSRRVVGTHTDITRQRAAEQALRDQQAAAAASRAKSEFLSRMSHEMRTPLNAVLGFGQLLTLGGVDDELRQRYTGHILHAGRHLLSLVDDVLDLQQVEEGRLQLAPEPIVLRDAAATAMALIGPQAQARQLRAELAIDATLTVNADAKRLHQILLNLLSNAVKYNREGGSLRCSAVRAGTEVTLEVADSGRGLDAEQQRRLFQPFERLGYETSEIEGTGLGLIIARRLTEEMGGRLSLASEPGVGTCVTLTLPGAPDVTPATAPGALLGAAGFGTAGDNPLPLRLLYVEDNPLNALLFSEAIGSRAGIELRLAEDGTEALALVAHWQPDVLVIDARLPGLSGYEVLEHLRRRPGLAATPAFMCSADAMPEDLQRAADSGFAGYWTKPIDIDRVMHDLSTLRLPPLA